jgi:hypothetical protein
VNIENSVTESALLFSVERSRNESSGQKKKGRIKALLFAKSKLPWRLLR